MMGIRTADYLLAAAGLLGHGVVLLLLVHRGLLRRLPAFALLIAYYLLRSGLFLLPHLLASRPGVYWLLIYLDPGLQLLVMLSFAMLAFGVLGARRWTIAWSVPLLLLFAGLVGWAIGPSSHYSPQNLAIKLSLFVSALWIEGAVGGAIALFVLARKRDAEAIRLPLAIAAGFAVYSVINVVTEAVRTHYSLSGRHGLYAELSYLRVAAYLCILAAWSFLFWSTKHFVREDFYQKAGASR